ncbi:DUF2267 domain-containing protein [Tundrisphaera lichenicola]|uniref:DUF2267 domain-containing protein n=1 Tax=Tundrisphaera lichenicola TaxID=2029860 RepID=UPI003EBB91D3
MSWHDNRQRAFQVHRTVPAALRDRLTKSEDVDLGAQLPMLLRGLMYEDWNPTSKPIKDRKKERIPEHIAKSFRDDTEDFPKGGMSLFEILPSHVFAGEIGDVKHVLPADIRKLRPEGEATRGS